MTSVGVQGDKPKAVQRAVPLPFTSSGFVVAAVAGFRIKVYAYSYQSRNDAMSVQLTDGQGGPALDQVWTFNAREGVISPASVPDTYFFSTSLGNGLYAVITGTGTVDIAVSYWANDNFV